MIWHLPALLHHAISLQQGRSLHVRRWPQVAGRP